jgi:hypothetical protein
MKKAVRIQIVYDDGSQDLATGSAAEQLVSKLFACEDNIAWWRAYGKILAIPSPNSDDKNGPVSFKSKE